MDDIWYWGAAFAIGLVILLAYVSWKEGYESGRDAGIQIGYKAAYRDARDLPIGVVEEASIDAHGMTIKAKLAPDVRVTKHKGTP